MEEIKKKAAEEHPDWTEKMLLAYCVGYADAILDDHMRKSRGEET